MDARSFAAFLLVDLLLVMTPGADWAYAIAAGVRGRTVLPAVAGLAAGYVLHAGLVVIGVGALLAGSPTALHLLTLIGAAYLLWLGVTVARRSEPLAADGQQMPSAVRTALRGSAVSGLNPKGLLLFFAVLPQFVAPGASWPVTAQLAVLGTVHVLVCGLAYLAVALTARRLLRSRPRTARIVGRGSGIAMIVVAVALTLERALHA
ncbi:MAG TPA: LysE family translocator [Solirubrobacteraceae bacterium]|nr:LysE family translocator [Solirubrobacteraceae bacterium]